MARAFYIPPGRVEEALNAIIDGSAEKFSGVFVVAVGHDEADSVELSACHDDSVEARETLWTRVARALAEAKEGNLQ